MLGATGSRLVAEFAGDLERDAGCVYGSDLLRTRDRIAGGLNESRSVVGLDGPKLGTRDGGANSTLIEGGAIEDAWPISVMPLSNPWFKRASPGMPYISVGAGGNWDVVLALR